MHDDISRDICRLLATANLAEHLERRLSEQLQEAARAGASAVAVATGRAVPTGHRPASKVRVG